MTQPEPRDAWEKAYLEREAQKAPQRQERGPDAQDAREEAFHEHVATRGQLNPWGISGRSSDGRPRHWIVRYGRWAVGPLIVLLLLIVGPSVWDAIKTSQMEADIPAIEKAIRDDLADQGSNATVDCPSSIDWEAGSEFHCVATDDQGGRYRVTVSMENDEGDVTWVYE